MRRSIRPQLGNDDDLERLQNEFFAKQHAPAATVARGSRPKGQSLFAQRRQAARKTGDHLSAGSSQLKEEEALDGMPALESENNEFETQDKPHVPVSKNMLDLTSLLGSVLSEVKENTVDAVSPPTLPPGTQKSQQHVHGFPRPARRKLSPEPMYESSASQVLPKESFEAENVQKIQSMSAEEIEEARQEIFATLSSESIDFILNRHKKGDTNEKEKQKSNLKPVKGPTEEEKLAWTMDIQPTPAAVDDTPMTESDAIFKRKRFDLSGNVIDPKADIPVHKGLHHHGEEPDKAGYTLAELFHLSRSQMPSQRALVLTTLSRILWQAKSSRDTGVLNVFRRADLGATIYLRSALDDRHLVVIVSAVEAMAALVLDKQEWEEDDTVRDAKEFNQFLGYVRAIPASDNRNEQSVRSFQDRFVEFFKKQGKAEDEVDDAKFAEKDLVRGLVRMNILARMRYLMGRDSELRDSDSVSMQRLTNMLVHMAQAGPDVCEAILHHDLLDLVLEWGLVDREWPITQACDNVTSVYPSLAALRLLTILSQGSRNIAKVISAKAAFTLKYLVTSPQAAPEPMQYYAYALQIETLKLFRVLLCYGFVVPALQELHEPMISWLRAVLTQTHELDNKRAACAMSLLELSLHAAADPHKTTPAHAIDWHQPTAFLPVIMAITRTNQQEEVLETALGYLAALCSYIDKFPAMDDTVSYVDIWKSITEEAGARWTSSGHSNGVLRYMQFLKAFASVKHSTFAAIAEKSKESLCSEEVCKMAHRVYKDGILGRLSMWMWIKEVKDRSVRVRLWPGRLDEAELQVTFEAVFGCAAEAEAAEELVQHCVLSRIGMRLAPVLSPFYLQYHESDAAASRAVFGYDGANLPTLMYAQPRIFTTATSWVFSPIDEVFYMDKSQTAQHSKFSETQIIRATLEAASILLAETNYDHDVAVVSLMKIFVVGDRAGADMNLAMEKEVFFDDEVEKWTDVWLDRVCQTHMGQDGFEGQQGKRAPAESFEDAWRRSSLHTRQSFFQFYQTFVAQYAAVSFGHRGFARLLAYVIKETIDALDYKHLVYGDYREILPTLKADLPEV